MELIDKAAVVTEIENRIKKLQNLYKEEKEKLDSIKKIAILLCIDECKVILSLLDTLEVKEMNEKSETACRSEIIKVKCISPFDETWEKGKVYTGEKWHHEGLNMDFWDIYYDYDNNPKYVQFSSIEMLEKEFAILRNDTIEVKEVDLVEEFADFLEKENAYVDDNNILL